MARGKWGGRLSRDFQPFNRSRFSLVTQENLLWLVSERFASRAANAQTGSHCTTFFSRGMLLQILTLAKVRTPWRLVGPHARYVGEFSSNQPDAWTWILSSRFSGFLWFRFSRRMSVSVAISVKLVFQRRKRAPSFLSPFSQKVSICGG